jgi:hypothetical protein
MPRWVVTCPQCAYEFTHTEISAEAFDQADRDPFHVLPKPSGGARTCPNCKTESKFERRQLYYRESAKGQASSS